MKLRKLLLPVITAVVAVVLTVLSGEGLNAISRLERPDTSITYRLISRLSSAPTADDLTGPDSPNITNIDQIRPLLPALEANAVGMGNSPFNQLKHGAAAVKHVVDGCEELKPNLRKVMSFLRSELFNTFEPLNYFYDDDRQLPADIQQFFGKYSFRKTRLTTNEVGERTTLPLVKSSDKILIAGDSLGMSAMVDDNETLASQLQAIDMSHQYVNIGVPGTEARNIICVLERAAKRYAGQVREVIYPFSENDLDDSAPYGKPEELIAWLARFGKENGIQRITIIFMPYIYNSVSDLTRIPGNDHYDWPRNWAKKRKLLSLAEQEGLQHLDFTDITEEERRNAGTQFAALALYVDQAHLSRLGIERLVHKLRALNGYGGA